MGDSNGNMILGSENINIKSNKYFKYWKFNKMQVLYCLQVVLGVKDI
jgi:hypothetical protein